MDDKKKRNQNHSRSFKSELYEDLIDTKAKKSPKKSKNDKELKGEYSDAAPAVVVGGKSYTFELHKGEKRTDMTKDEKTALNKL